MISFGEYLEAKEIVTKYEKEHIKRIGVLYFDKNDLKNWLINKKCIRNLNVFKIDDVIYHPINKITDLISYDFDGYIETEKAKLNNDYNIILNSMRMCVIN